MSRLFFVQSIAQTVGDRSLRAWDLGRVVALSRWGFEVGFLSENEAWEVILRNGTTLYGLYLSWTDYGANYLLGRMFWSSSREDFVEFTNTASKALSRLLNRRGNVWHDLPFPSRRLDRGIEASIFDILYLQSKEARSWDLCMAGIKEYRARNYVLASKQFATAVKYTPEFAEAFLYLATSYRAKGDYTACEGILGKYKARWPRDAKGPIALGELYEALDKQSEALAQFE